MAGENTEGWGEKAFESVFGSGDGEDLEAARIREDLKKELYERALREEKEIRMRLARAGLILSLFAFAGRAHMAAAQTVTVPAFAVQSGQSLTVDVAASYGGMHVFTSGSGPQLHRVNDQGVTTRA